MRKMLREYALGVAIVVTSVIVVAIIAKKYGVFENVG